MAEKYTNFYNARAEPLFCSLNLLFYQVLVAIVVMVCLKSLFSHGWALDPNVGAVNDPTTKGNDLVKKCFVCLKKIG